MPSLYLQSFVAAHLLVYQEHLQLARHRFSDNKRSDGTRVPSRELP